MDRWPWPLVAAEGSNRRGVEAVVSLKIDLNGGNHVGVIGDKLNEKFPNGARPKSMEMSNKTLETGIG